MPRDVVNPAKLLRVVSLLGTARNEAREVELDDGTVGRLAKAAAGAVVEIAGGVSDDLASELRRLLGPHTEELTSRESQVVVSQLVGWTYGTIASGAQWIDPTPPSDQPEPDDQALARPPARAAPSSEPMPTASS